MKNDDLKEKIRSTLIGVAYGDAMGMPSEMMTRELFRQAFPHGIKTFEPSSPYDFFQRTFLAGQVTDDTMHTFLVIRTMLQNQGKFDIHTYMELLQAWLHDHPKEAPLVTGPSTIRALGAISKGMSYAEAGKYGHTNGAAMKAAPLGFIHDYRNLSALCDDVEQLCLPTHHTGIGIGGACVVSALVSYGIHGGHDLKDMWCLAAEAFVQGNCRGNQLPMPDMLERFHIVQELIHTEEEADVLRKMEQAYGTGMEMIETIPAVLAIVTLSQFDPCKAARMSANLCQDSDTIGSISCAICGSICNTFAEEDIRLLERVNQLDFQDTAEALALVI